MMDMGISGAAPAADPSAVVKGGSRSKDTGSGFDDALTQASGRDGGKAADQRDDGAPRSTANTSKAGDDKGNNRAKAPAAPQRAASTAAQPKTQPARPAADTDDDQQAVADTVVPSVTDALPADAAPATDEKAAAAALAAMLASTVLGANETDETADAGDAKGAADGDETDKTTDADGKQAATDALTLLGTAPPATPAPAPAPAASAVVVPNPLPMPAPQPQPAAKDEAPDATAKSKAGDSLAALAQAASGNDDDVDDTDTVALPATKAQPAGANGNPRVVFDLSSARGRDDNTDIGSNAVNAGNIDVTVLDQRRYLGLASGPNSATILGTLGGNGEWTSAMSPSSALSNQALWTSTGKVVNTLKIQLHPQDLGTVTATMRLSGEELSIDLKVHTNAAYHQLSSDQSHILDALRSQGYSVDRVTVSLATSDGKDANGGSGFQGQQQATANQNQGGEAQSRRQGYSGQQANGNDGNWSAGDAETNDGAGGAGRRSRAGGVYL